MGPGLSILFRRRFRVAEVYRLRSPTRVPAQDGFALAGYAIQARSNGTKIPARIRARLWPHHEYRAAGFGLRLDAARHPAAR